MQQIYICMILYLASDGIDEIWSSNLCSKNKTFAFWIKFINEVMFAYIQLFVAIRSQNWNLRMCSLKTIAKLFHAFDRFS